MPTREKKSKVIDQIEEMFSKCSVGILTNFRGMPTAELVGLRRKLGELGIDYHVVKNTLARLAAERLGKKNLTGLFEGPVAIACGYGDVVQPAKILSDYIRTAKVSLSIKGGFLGDRVLTPEDVATLVRLPSREVLLARVVGGMQIPIYGLLGQLTAPMRGFMTILQARIKQLEGK